MRAARVRVGDATGIAVPSDAGSAGGDLRVLLDHPRGDDLGAMLRAGPGVLPEVCAAAASRGRPADADEVTFLPPVPHPSKIVCVGLNYREHAVETSMAVPEFPALFARFESTFVGHGQPIRTSPLSEQLDYEGELVAVIGSMTRDAAPGEALEAVAGYSLFNDASVRDYQMRSLQWTPGKNFDGTGGFGPWLVTADELPPGASGLHIETRLNGRVVQSASTADLIFDVATLVSILSSFMTLEPGDLIVTGTPSGVGMSRTPPLWMRPGDVCEVEVEGIGVLRNPVA